MNPLQALGFTGARAKVENRRCMLAFEDFANGMNELFSVVGVSVWQEEADT